MTKENKLTLFYILFAFCFAFGVRFIWYWHFADNASMMWNDELMINTNDGYFYAEGARDNLAGFHQKGDLSPINSALSVMTAFLAKILPLSFESILLFMPAFFSSLIVIPMILIARSFNNLNLGVICALLAGVAWSYYNRTLIGYYDTDMLIIVLPMFVLWSMIEFLQKENILSLVFLAFFELVYIWWYSQSVALLFACFFVSLLYILSFSKTRKKASSYYFLAVMLFGMLRFSFIIEIIGLIALITCYKLYKNDIKKALVLLALVFVSFLFSSIFSIIFNKLLAYVFRSSNDISSSGLKLHFFSVMQTVREASDIPFDLFAKRISGSVAIFAISMIGLVWLFVKKPIMLLGLPILALGLIALNSGLRFTIYAVPMAAFGFAFFVVNIFEIIHDKYNKNVSFVFLVLFLVAAIYPNIKHAKEYLVPSVFNNFEVELISNMGKKASREDYVISWWDYGYPLRYYADMKTLIDGGKHSGSQNFAPSFILTNPQEKAAKLARLEVEYTEKKLTITDKLHNKKSNIEIMMSDYNYTNTNDFLAEITSLKMPKKTRDIYLYLPFRMMSIFQTVARFSSQDLMSGKLNRELFIYISNTLSQNENILDIGHQIKIDLSRSVVKIGNNEVSLKQMILLHNKDNKIQVEKSINYNPNGYLSLVMAKPYGQVYLMDDNTFNSSFIQMLLLGNYDDKIFTLIEENPYAKIFKLND